MTIAFVAHCKVINEGTTNGYQKDLALQVAEGYPTTMQHANRNGGGYHFTYIT
jgi:hypothetical protein